MYMVQLKLKTFDVIQKWTTDQVLNLIMLVSHYGNEWTLIQKNNFPSRTKEQIRQKYLSVK